jgi:hypothetical protein
VRFLGRCASKFPHSAGCTPTMINLCGRPFVPWTAAKRGNMLVGMCAGVCRSEQICSDHIGRARNTFSITARHKASIGD